ncbi:MAG: sensor histidine kinase, partial [Bacillota bacterium]
LSERNKLKYVLTGMEEGILAINNRKEIIIINNSAKRILDIRHEEPVGHQLSSLVSQDKIVELISKSLDDEFVVQDEFLLNIDNSDKRILLRCTPIYSNGKSLWGVVALFQDISQRWRFEQLQKDFVANVSHELKAPLSSIKGAGEILLDKVIVDSDKQDEYLEMIIEETDRLEDLVNDILTLSESDSSKSNYKRNKVNVNILLEKVTQIFKKIIDQENYKLETVLLEKDEYISMSEEKSKQVLLNLLENAYKFSSDGFIKIGAKNLSGEIKFWVKDYGIGISENEIDNIWERFYKVDKAHTPGTSGSGLGLSIVKQIIENNGGRVFVESKYGCGSTFGFYLPKI